MHRSARGVVVDIAELSDAGRDPAKQVNEDSSGYAETRHGHLAVVCDGMGGHSGGREAGQTAARIIVEHVQQAPGGVAPGPLLRAAIEAAGHAVYALGGDAPAGLRPGSTCVAMLLHERGVEIAHVGDSRGYVIRGGTIQHVTRDHSMVRQMLDAGVLTPEEAIDHPESNKITRALGIHPDVEVELCAAPLPLLRGDVLLLCSDGLTDLVAEPELALLVQSHMSSGPAVACQTLVALANDRGGYDNITVEILHVLETPAREPATVAGATLIDAPDGGAGHTLASKREYGVEPHRPTPSPTLADATVPHDGPSPTLLDEPFRHARTTEPGAATAEALPRADFHEPAPGEGPARHARWMVLLSGVIAALIVGGVAIWAIARFVSGHRSSGTVPSSPEQPCTATAPTTLLEASTPPESGTATASGHERHHRTSEPGEAPADAGHTPDAGRDGGNAGFP